MRSSSLDPWLNITFPKIKTILLYGNHIDLRQFRTSLLRRLYKSRGYTSITVKSWSTLEQALVPRTDLFQEHSSPYFIQCHNVTDAFFKEKSLEPLLDKTPHVLLLESATMTSRSTLVAAYEKRTDRIGLGCYEVDFQEIDQSVKWMAASLNLTINEEIKQMLTNYLLTHLPDFFSVLEFISLYVGNADLKETTLAQILKEHLLFSPRNLSASFFQQNVNDFMISIDHLETTDWIGQIRLLLQDVVTLMGLSAYKLSPNSLQNTWKNGPVKFPFPFLNLYQSVLTRNWSLEKGYKILSGLLTLEMTLKSGDVLSPAIFKRALLNLKQII